MSKTYRQFKRVSGYYRRIFFPHRTIDMNSTSQNIKENEVLTI